MQAVERDLQELSSADIIAGLRRQYQEFLREGYDGHNRHSGITTMRGFRIKGWRRRENMRLGMMAQEYNAPQNIY